MLPVLQIDVLWARNPKELKKGALIFRSNPVPESNFHIHCFWKLQHQFRRLLHRQRPKLGR